VIGHISASGPITDVYVGADLRCQLRTAADGTTGEFYPPGSAPANCATFTVVDGVLYGAFLGGRPYELVSQGAAGSGTPADPFTLTTVVNLRPETSSPPVVQLRQTDTYVDGEPFYRTEIRLQNVSGGTHDVILYRAGDCYFARSDSGYGFHGEEPGSIGCAKSDLTRGLAWVPLTSGSHFYEAHYSDVWDQITATPHHDFPDTCECDQLQDNGSGLSWSLALSVGSGTATIAHRTALQTPPAAPTPTPGG
jgi:hypothetical protein